MHPALNAVFFAVLSKLCAFFKVSFIIGSHYAFFSFSQTIMPLSGAFAGVAGSTIFFSLKMLIAFCMYATFPAYLLAYHVPGFFASLYWSSSSKYLKTVIPLLCMGAFIMHPVGSGAALYALFWLLPLIALWGMKESIFSRALGSTFTAHAVGSVIWLYTVPMSADAWFALIPFVILERTLFVLGMMGGYIVLEKTLAAARTFFGLSSFCGVKVF